MTMRFLRRGKIAVLVALATTAPVHASSQSPRRVGQGFVLDTTIAPSAVHDFALTLSAGESANLAVTQMGVDLVVEVHAPNDSVSTFDSPNGRNGDEPVEIIAAVPGTYRVQVRPYDGREPAGRYRFQVTAWRSAAATREMLHGRELARDSATRWLASRSAPIPPNAIVSARGALPPLDAVASRARVIGIGEANHGSREFGDLRLSLTRRLIERNGFRVVAIEASSSRLDLLNHFVAGEAVSPSTVTEAIERGWISRRPLRAIVTWLRQWNSAHSSDRVQLVGVDPQDNQIATDTLRGFLARAYGTDLITRLAPTFGELAAADSQYLVFGDSDVDSSARRAILEVVALLDLDSPTLTQKFGAAAVERSREAARQMAELADLNSGDNRLLGHSRDWYMATRVLAAIERQGPGAKAVFWAHNAHVGIRGENPAGKSSGAWLREALGCRYAPIGVAFGQGSFVAQVPNDLADRLAVSTLPLSPAESIDGVLAAVNPSGTIVGWPCSVDSSAIPGWLRAAHPMHWVGGLYAPGTSPSEAFRPYNLLRDFDGVIYVGKVTADELPTDRPLVPARKR
jgi:erythromycin esterase